MPKVSDFMLRSQRTYFQHSSGTSQSGISIAAPLTIRPDFPGDQYIYLLDLDVHMEYTTSTDLNSTIVIYYAYPDEGPQTALTIGANNLPGKSSGTNTDLYDPGVVSVHNPAAKPESIIKYQTAEVDFHKTFGINDIMSPYYIKAAVVPNSGSTVHYTITSKCLK